MNYGLPYMGSKNLIAKQIIDCLPPAEHFYDLFAGGCAMTHVALLSGKYKYIHCNDITSVPQLFLSAIRGDYHDETRWIDRHEFARLRATDHYVRLCWSFGNKGTEYLYSKEVEPWKRAYHFAVVFGDFEPLFQFSAPLTNQLFNSIPHDANKEQRCSIVRTHIRTHLEEWKSAYIAWYKETFFGKNTKSIEELSADIASEKERLRQYLLDHLNRSGLRQRDIDRYLGTQMSGHYFGKSQWAFPTEEVYEQLRPIMNWTHNYPITYKLAEQLQSLESLERLERLQRLQSLQSLERLEERIIVTQGDYRDVKIEPNSVIYCDPPYRGRTGYNDGTTKIIFDHEAFYDWAEQQDNIFISEYNMP